ncbi:hypothetical protein TOPH_00876 [Tolypocladium ophioglossoides CBS 100239]|uniref:MARVEL domain-containing protein n=1 Tax=Tolypocladium ophioglossoides (strain CBS 100239) TaxID=1163406 RepID=A0A0L0NK56_TOLOC|nr:hypothetical protein TOPH_00876 [Tolypocladium ophioglossoides CBS 100239]
MGRTTTISLRVFQGLLAAANLGLSAYVINYYLVGTKRAGPGSLNFLVFASCFSMLSILYLELAPKVYQRAAHPYAALGVEATNTVFYFAGFIAYAVFLGGLALCHGTVCTAGRIDSVVAAAAFCAWIASTILTAKGMFMGAVHRPGDKAMHTGEV